MFRSKFVAIAMAAGSVALCGCPGRTSNALSSMAAPVIGDPPSVKVGGVLRSPEHSRHSASRRASDRDVSTVGYNDAEYGIAFRYPRDYALEEGDIEEHSYFLRRQEELEGGATLLATVLIPEDAYPNTTFEHGSLQVAVNDEVSREGCKALVSSDTGGTRQGGVRAVTVDGMTFWRSEERTTMADTEIVERDYAGFANDRCYEFFAVVAVGELTDNEDGVTRAADAGKVFRQLEKILMSVRLNWAVAVPEEISRTGNGPRL